MNNQTVSDIEWSKHCRTCLTNINLSPLDENIRLILTECISVQTPFKTSPESQICTNCHDFLIKYDAFKRQVMKIEAILDEKYVKNEQTNDDINEPVEVIDVKCKPSDLQSDQIQCYQCTYCNERLPEKMKLITHASIHVKFKTYTCAICEKVYEGLGTITRHFNSYHAEHARGHQCPHCAESFLIHEQLEFHQIQHTKPTCPVCHEQFPNFRAVREHAREHQIEPRAIKRTNKQKSYACAICKREIYTKGKYAVHMRKHRGEFICACPVCHVGFYAITAFTTHVKNAHVDLTPSLVCVKCTKMFFVDAQLKAHEARAHPQTQCTFCRLRFKSRRNLERHMRGVHAHVTRFKCVECGKELKLEVSLKKHMETHRAPDDKRHVCNICGKKYLHMRSHLHYAHAHARLKAFRCRYCHETYAIWSELLKHSMHAHKQERARKKFACKLCAKRFTHNANVQRHMLCAHNDKRAFECAVCGKTFKTQSNVQVHMRSHTDERPFACDLCEKSFRVRTTLESHRRTHTGERPFVCDVCLKAFAQRSALRTHLKVHGAFEAGKKV